jgi:hypothetical protein
MMIRRGLDGIVEVPRDNLDRAFAELAISVNDAFSKAWEDLPPVGTVESDRERYAVALWCVALFFSRFGAPFADRFFDITHKFFWRFLSPRRFASRLGFGQAAD